MEPEKGRIALSSPPASQLDIGKIIWALIIFLDLVVVAIVWLVWLVIRVDETLNYCALFALSGDLLIGLFTLNIGFWKLRRTNTISD